jgi:hypothetical protein
MADTSIQRLMSHEEWVWCRERYGERVAGDVALLINYLGRWDDPQARLFALREYERGMRAPPQNTHTRRMTRALAVWRLYQQHHCD